MLENLVPALILALMITLRLDYAAPAEGYEGVFKVFDQLCRSFPNGNADIPFLFSVGGISCLLHVHGRAQHHNRGLLIVPSLFFGFAMTFGYALQQTDDIALLFHGLAQRIKTVASFTGWSVVFYLAVDALFNRFDDCLEAVHEDGESPVPGVQRVLDAHPFLAPVIILAIAWLPTIIGYMPALFMSDSVAQVQMYFGFENQRSVMVELIDPEVTITTHFSVIHTLFLGACIELGLVLFGSASAGAFVYTLIQVTLTLLAVGYASAVLYRLGVPFAWRMACIVLLAVVPWYSGYAVLATRDTLFADALLVLFMALFSIRFLEERPVEWILIAVASILVSLLRSGALLFVLAPSAVFAAQSLKERNGGRAARIAAVALAATAVFVIFSRLLYPALRITSGSKVEMLSVPLQQTARYVRDHADSLTQEEREAIDGVLVLEGLGDRYDPVLSDAVKDYAALHRHNATDEDWARYWQAYLSMGRKDPICYLTATLNNYYGYFYPSRDVPPFYTYRFSADRMDFLRSSSGIDIHHSEGALASLLVKVDYAYLGLFQRVPVLRFFLESWFWCWTLILATAYAIHRRLAHVSFALVSLWMIMLVILIGPINGAAYTRYIYPFAMTLPFVIAVMPRCDSKGDGPHGEAGIDDGRSVRMRIG